MMNMDAGDWIALAALGVSLISIVITLYEKHRAEHESFIKTLQGEKENVAYTAIKISSKQWPNNPFSENHRDEVIASLCLAWIMEKSDRARALVLSALEELAKDERNRRKIAEILIGVEKQFKNYVCRAYSDN